ncbi:MAG TPA: alcohol dehydrogenase catalytic domain-containing protein [Acidimicrobiales bacterium]|nr:alcohol dehydrogenase catalytic domain-containing protein [Acidimicrobiales bacterium]
MRALVVREPGSSAVLEWPEPVDGDGEIVVRPLLAGMCGTDLELIDGTIDPAYVRYPLVLGHEWAGELLSESELGPIGTRVVVEGIVPCTQCDACHRGATNLCEVYDEIGFTRAGAIAERIRVPAASAHRLSDDVELADAVLIEPMAVVWRALTRITLRPGLRVAVVGDGTIALLAAHLVQLFSPLATTVIGRREEQRDLALRAGADEFLTEMPDESFDLVIEAAGNASAVQSAIEHCARGGMVILLGLPPHGTTVEIAPDNLVNHDIIIQASFSYTRAAFADVVARLNAGELHPSFLITHRFTLETADRAIAALRGGSDREPRGKVVVDLAAS